MFLRTIKAYIWLFTAWWVKTFGIRNQAWFNEHVSRVKHLLATGFGKDFDYAAYARAMLAENKANDKSCFVPLIEDEQVPHSGARDNGGVKIIAFYLPQYHTFEQNDQWHGRGFTEWTNVTRAIPQFIGQHQPQLPIDVGFYDLSSPKVMYRQVELAKMYGVHGFCFHYYWFSGGKRLLEKPIFNWLGKKDLAFPFMLCWANENWSRLWDGGNRQVLMRQESRVEDAEDFFDGIVPFLKDDRYIRIDGRPHLIVYRPNLFTRENWLRFSSELRRLAKNAGLGGLFLSMVGHENFDGTGKDWGVDGVVEFPPMRLSGKRVYSAVSVNPDCKTLVYDMEKIVSNGSVFDIQDEGVPVFRGAFPGWDNTARKAYSNASCYITEPKVYETWLRGLVKWERDNNPVDKRFVFINAWNEWAEGAHLEPDNRYGYAYLAATRKALFAES